MSPERHHWKPAVQAAAVMLRTPPVDGQSQASQPGPLPIYGAQSWERPSPPVTRRSPASSARTPSRAFALSRHLAGWMQACNYGSHYVAIATQRVHRLQIRPIAQLWGILYYAPKLHPGPCNSVGIRPQTDRQTHRRAWLQYILCHLRLTQNVIITAYDWQSRHCSDYIFTRLGTCRTCCAVPLRYNVCQFFGGINPFISHWVRPWCMY